MREIDPEHLLVVCRIADAGRTEELVVISCRYAPAVDSTGKRAVGVELIFDPENQRPATPYSCTDGRLHRELVDPRSVSNIRPYAA